jgi:glycosyltransferase involved in cell wall biosynthesis
MRRFAQCPHTPLRGPGIRENPVGKPKVCRQRLISIVVPVYNAEKTLKKCLDSVLAQTRTELELILVDDGSTDGSAKIVDAYAKKDARVRAVHTPNRGVSAARNTGLGLASGDFVGFADTDDWVEPNMFERLIGLIEREDADIAVCGYYRRPEGAPPETASLAGGLVSPERAYRLALETKAFGGFVWNKLFKSDFFAADGYRLRFDESVHVCEDLLLVCECLCRAQRIACDPSLLYHYSVSKENAGGRPFSQRRTTLLNARKKLAALTRQRFPRLASIAESLYVADTVHTFFLAVRSGAKAACLKDHLRGIRRYVLSYVFRKKSPFSYKLMAPLICLSPRMAEALYRRFGDKFRMKT